jgi:hypothetical protein
VGRIDLLCRDSNGHIVVIEIKKFRAGTGSIIDQITRYMGGARHHVAGPGQQDRGIIIVGKPDEKLVLCVAKWASAPAIRDFPAVDCSSAGRSVTG